MNSESPPSLPPGPPGRSNVQLQTIINDLVQKDILLGKHERSLVPTKPVTVIEYESLKFEHTSNSVKAIQRHYRPDPIVEGPNCNKIGYKNAGLWSPRSIHLEQLMKPLLSSSMNLWPDYETINEMLSKTDLVSEEQLQFAMVDTLLVRMNEANEVRYGFDRLYSHWSYTTNQFEMRKEWVDKIELDILVLSLINDHTAAVQLKKEQTSLGGMGRHTQTTSSAAAAATITAASKIHKLVSALPGVNPSTTRRKVLSEGECRTHAVLKAVCRDGTVHIRPLCTSGDVLLALHELLDPVIFIHGCIQLPHVLSDIFARHTEGFYRYIYTLNQPGQWQYLRIHLPAPLQWLSQFVQPAFVQPHAVFHVENIPPEKVPVALRQNSIYLTKLICKHYGKTQLLQRMVVDFEACMDITNVVVKKVQKRTKFTANGIVTINPPNGNNNSSGGVNGEMYGENIPAPHLHNSEEPPKHRYFFRLLHIAETQFLQSWAGQRRDAVCYMHSSTKLELRNFEEYFREQWAMRKREFNKNRAALYMTPQQGSATIFNPTAIPINTAATANVTMIQPHNRYNASAKDTTLLSNVGFSPISSRMSSYTPFLPIRTAQDSSATINNSTTSSKSNATLSPTRNTTQNHNTYHGMLNQVLTAMQPSAKNGSILRPGSTLSAKHALSTAMQNTFSNESNSSSKFITSSRRAQVGGSADAALRDMLTSSRSKKFTSKSSKESDSNEVDPAKLDAIHLVNVLFGRKYHKRILRDKQRLESTSYDDEDSDSEEPVRTFNAKTSTNLSQSMSYSNSSSDISDSDQEVNSQQSSEEAEEEESQSDSDSLSDIELHTVFRFVPGAKNSNDAILPSAMVAQKESRKQRSTKASAKSSGKSSINRTGDRSIVAIPRQPTLSRTTGTVNFVSTASTNRPSIVNTTTGKAPRQSFLVHGEGSRKSRKSVSQNPDQVILQRYHTTEKQRQEKEARCADVVRSWQDIQHKLAEEKALAEKNPYSVYFVPRTSSASFHSAVPSNIHSNMNSPIIGSPVGSPVMGNSAAKGAMAVLRARKRFLEVGKTGKESKTTQGIGHVDSSDAGDALEEETRRYRALMEPARDDYVQHYSPTKTKPHNATLVLSPYGTVPTTVDKELYFAVDKVTYRERDSSPNKSKTHTSAPKEPLSPSKMYAERNKTPPSLPPATTRVKTRNDEEFNSRAYKLAEKIDLTYLVSSFNPANHSKDKTIVLDEDLALLNATALSESILNTSTAAATEPVVELTPAEKRQRALDYAAYMKQLYEDEMALMMENLVSQLPDKLGSKVRKALAAQKLRQKMKERLKYIQRRRKVEKLGSDQVEKLSKFYELQGEYVMTDSSSDDEAAKAKASREMNNLLGEFANMDEAQMKALLEARAAEEQAERDAEEAKRLRRASVQARKEAEAQAKADQLAAAAAAAEEAVYADEPPPPEAPVESPNAEAARRGSMAQMRKTMRTFSLMQITKVLLDGTIIPQCTTGAGAVNNEGSLDGSESEVESKKHSAQSSRPATTQAVAPVVIKRLNEFGELVDEEGEAADGAPRPRSRPAGYTINRPSLWGPVPASWRGDLPVAPRLEEQSEAESSVMLPSVKGVEESEERGSKVVVPELQTTESDIASTAELPPVLSVLEQSSMDPLDAAYFSRRFSNRCDSPLVDILTRTEPPPVHGRRPSSTVPSHVLQSQSFDVGITNASGSEKQYATLADRINAHQQNNNSDTDEDAADPNVAHEQEHTRQFNKYPFSRENTFLWDSKDPVLHDRTEQSGQNIATPESKSKVPERKFSGGERIPSANISVRIKVRERGLSATSALESSSVVDEIVSHVKETAVMLPVDKTDEGVVDSDTAVAAGIVGVDKIVLKVPKDSVPLNTGTLPKVAAVLAGTHVSESKHEEAERIEDVSVISTLTGPESELSRENSELMDVQDLLKALRRPAPASTSRIDAFVHRPALRSATVSNSVMTVGMEGRPPSGLVFNLVKPATPMKASPMEKINSGKGLPFLKKPPHKKVHEAYTPTRPVKHVSKHPDPVVENNQDVVHKPGEEITTKSSQQGSKGLYLIPGAAVASFVQKPSAEKPSRPVIYTTRVQMQQKLREMVADPGHDSVTVSTLTCGSDEIFPGMTLQDSPVNLQDLHDRFSFKSEFNDSYLPPEENLGTENSACEVELSGELAQLSGMFVDSCHNITSVQLSTYDNSKLLVAEKSSFNDDAVVRPLPHEVSEEMEEVVEIDDRLQLSTEEWQLVLTAARAQASDLDFDIVQQDDIEREYKYTNVPHLRAGSVFDAEMTPRTASPDLLPTDSHLEAVQIQPSAALKGLSSSIDGDEAPADLPLAPPAPAEESPRFPVQIRQGEKQTSRLACIGEENFNWRVSRTDRSVLWNDDTDLLEMEDNELNDAPSDAEADRTVNTPHVVISKHHHTRQVPPRAPQTLEELLRQLGVLPLKASSPTASHNVSPSVSPGRARHQAPGTHKKPSASSGTQVGAASEDPALQITKSMYANKHDILPHRPLYTRPLTPQRASPRGKLSYSNAIVPAAAATISMPVTMEEEVDDTTLLASSVTF